MASWSHLLARHGAVNPDQSLDQRNYFRSSAATTTTSSTSFQIPIPEQFEHSLDSVLLRRLSSNSQDMSQDQSDCSLESYQAAETTIPRRNLTEAFEDLYIEPPAEAAVTPAVKGSDNQGMNGGKLTTNMISPTGVADLPMERPEMSGDTTPERCNLMTPRRDESSMEANSESDQIPHFFLHPVLKRELSQALVNRVSFYGVLHDINKEATAMASNDDSGYNRNPEDMLEEFDAIVIAVNGFPQKPVPASTSMSQVALIDEERWLLEAIDARGFDESRSIQACPPTFLQAMGERDYENPLASLSNGSRTQLWKPSRSWWEAKSGKNPWIEPKSHNKRWR